MEYISLRERKDNKWETATKISATKKQSAQEYRKLWQTTIKKMFPTKISLHTSCRRIRAQNDSKPLN
jgi:hypothetical protein